jgi:nicotinamide-nucleotide amidase
MPQPNPRPEPPSIVEVTSTPAEDAVHALRRRGLSLATAESLTGGGLGDAVTSVPGASAVYAGGVVTYATRVKVDLLGVPGALVARHGVVSSQCAAAMASRVRELIGADVGVATTGVAGPDPQEGKAVGLVYVAVAGAPGASDAREVVVDELHLSGDRAAIRRAAVAAALRLVVRRLEDEVGQETSTGPRKPTAGS